MLVESMHNFSNMTDTHKGMDQIGKSVFHKTLIDQILITTVILLFVTWIYVSNITLITVLLKYKLATPPNAALRIALAISDIVVGSLSLYILIPLLFMDNLFNVTVCGVVTDCVRATIGLSMIITVTLSFERLIYFKEPLRYTSLERDQYLLSFLILYYTAVIIYFVTVGVISGHTYKTSELSCPGKNVNTLHLFVRLAVSFGIPTVIIVSVLIMIKKVQSCALAPEAGHFRESIRRTVRLILLLSGSTIVALLPITAAYITILRYFPSRQESESVVISLRNLTLILCLLSPSLNPVIQFILEKDMYVGALRLFGRTAFFSWQREMQTTVNVLRASGNVNTVSEQV